jgi:uncharacterized SAM-binding protein YcdF (DUF218 family)
MDSLVSHTPFARRYGWWLAPVLIVLAIAIAWMARAAILRDVAELWVVSDPLDRADAIVVLGGRIDLRPFAAADLYRRGFAPRVLISNVARDVLETMQLWPGQTELTRQLLLKFGVPAEAIVEFGNGVTSTYEEARAVLDWTRSSGARSVIIPTDLFPTRRVRWTFQQEVASASTGVRVIVHAIKPRAYGLDDWWRDERGLIDFQNEVIKFFYYRLNH